MLLAFLVVAFILRSVCPSLNAESVLEVISPVALVFRSVDVSIHTVSVGLIILPLAVEDVAVNMPELSLSVSLVVLPLSFIARAIGPHLDTSAMTNCSLPLALVYCAVLEAILISILEWSCIVKSFMTEVTQALLTVMVVIEGPRRLEPSLPLLRVPLNVTVLASEDCSDTRG